MKTERYGSGVKVVASASTAETSRPVTDERMGVMSLMEKYGLEVVSRRSGSKNEVKVLETEGLETVIQVRLGDGCTTPVRRRISNCAAKYGAVTGIKENEDGSYTVLTRKEVAE